MKEATLGMGQGGGAGSVEVKESDALGREGERHFLQGAGQTCCSVAHFYAGLSAVGPVSRGTPPLTPQVSCVVFLLAFAELRDGVPSTCSQAVR